MGVFGVWEGGELCSGQVEAVEGEEGGDCGVVEGWGGLLVSGVEGVDEFCGEGGFACVDKRC